jgi:hypothetical protein
LGAASVRETLEPADQGRRLTHSFTVTPGTETQVLWCRLAAGTDITPLANGWYAVNDKQYFIQLTGKEKPLLRTTAQHTKELLLPVRTRDKVAQVQYSIVW